MNQACQQAGYLGDKRMVLRLLINTSIRVLCYRSCSPFSDGLEQSEDSDQSASDHDGDETWEPNTKVQLRSQTATVPARAKRARKATETTNAPTSPEAAPSSSG